MGKEILTKYIFLKSEMAISSEKLELKFKTEWHYVMIRPKANHNKK